MAIRFVCARCGKRLEVKDQFGGRRSTCPACGSEIEVPFQSTWKGDETLPPPPSKPTQDEVAPENQE
jgi:DNA-directed RNA polymerase subunit RPC12/RpoP